MYLLKLKASLIRPHNTSSSRLLHIILFTFWLFSQASHFIDPFHHITMCVVHTNTIPYIITIRVCLRIELRLARIYFTAYEENTAAKCIKVEKDEIRGDATIILLPICCNGL